MEKEFFDVFPNLKVKDQLHEWLEIDVYKRQDVFENKYIAVEKRVMKYEYYSSSR